MIILDPPFNSNAGTYFLMGQCGQIAETPEVLSLKIFFCANKVYYVFDFFAHWNLYLLEKLDFFRFFN